MFHPLVLVTTGMLFPYVQQSLGRLNTHGSIATTHLTTNGTRWDEESA
jgi:hypothetical protein